MMWRYISPTLMATVIISSMYFMVTNTPKYTAWNRTKAIGEKKEYPEWALGIAAMLAMSGLIPIIIGLAIHLINTCTSSRKKHSAEPGNFFRVDTTASTRPILEDNFEEFPVSLFAVNVDSDDDTDGDSGNGIMMQNTEVKLFKMEMVQ